MLTPKLLALVEAYLLVGDRWEKFLGEFAASVDETYMSRGELSFIPLNSSLGKSYLTYPLDDKSKNNELLEITIKPEAKLRLAMLTEILGEALELPRAPSEQYQPYSFSDYVIGNQKNRGEITAFVDPEGVVMELSVRRRKN
ncbi:hypothetical protein NBRC116494_24800 [Aurantivibrio plasticivorans]